MSDVSIRADLRRDDETVDQSAMPYGSDDPFDQVAEEFAARCRRGESPSVESYVAQHPEHASRIRELLPTVAMMEQLKRRSQASRGKEPARAIPERLGEFRVIRELGRGGMGIVYEAVQEPLGRHIALKVIHQVQADPRRLLRFHREAMAVAQLHHTNIVPIFAVGEHEGLPYFAMQYIRGDSLDVVLARWRGGESARDAAARWRFAARVGMQAAGAIQHAHDRGVLHRDIKPANLLIDEEKTVWISDFGLAKLAGQDDLTNPGDVIGTLRYLAPEALQGDTGPRGDVYSLGLTLYEMLTLSLPFGDLNPSEMLHQLGEGTLPRPRAVDPAIPRDLETIILKAIAREPGHRYPTAGALGDDLRRFLEDRPIQARRVNVLERVWRWGRRNRTSATLSAVAAGALLLAAIVGLIGTVRTQQALAEAEKNLGQANHETAWAKAETRRADENFKIPFDFITQLVDKIAGAEETQGREFAPLDGAGRPGMMPPGGFLGPPPGGGMMPGVEPDLLQVIVTFYEQLAAKNKTDPKLQGEAAWAFFKLGAHHQRTGKPEEAEARSNQGLTILEGLAASHPEESRGFARLTSFPDMVDPWLGQPSEAPAIEQRLRRIDALLATLAGEASDLPGLARARMRVGMKLGLALQREGRAEESDHEVQAALSEAERLRDAKPKEVGPIVDLIEVRLAQAEIALDRNRLEQAWAVLEEIFQVIRSQDRGAIISVPIAERMELLAEGFRNQGQNERARILERRADEVDPRPPLAGPGPPGGPDGSPGGPRGRGPGPGPGPDGRHGPGPGPGPRRRPEP